MLNGRFALRMVGAAVMTPVLVIVTFATIGVVSNLAKKIKSRKLDNTTKEIKAMMSEDMKNEFAEVNKSIDDLNEKCKDVISKF